MVLTDEKRALLGDRKAAKRLTDTGVLLPCPHCGKRFIHWFPNQSAEVFGGYFCTDCNHGQAKIYPLQAQTKARLAWNTRAPVLTAEEMERLEAQP